MRILMVNKFFWLFAGSERYMFDTAAELERAGHTIIHFSMTDAHNRPSPYSPYFVSNIQFNAATAAYKLKKLPAIVGKTVYSFESRRKMAALLRETRPDVAHLHMIDHQISPSILHALRDADVPVVQTLHDFKLVCPANGLFRRRVHQVCEQCLHGQFGYCVWHRCVKDSLAASTLAAAGAYFHRAIRIYEQNVDLFLASSDFLANKLAEGGVPRAKIRKCFLTTRLGDLSPVDTMGDYIVYAGRLLPDKGLDTLVRAMARLPQCQLVIVGEGEDRPALEQLAATLGARNVRFVGYQSGDALVRWVAESRGMVLPSECYETCGLVIWEAYALHRPVVAARIGGIPEFVDEGQTGYLFEPGNAGDLADRIAQMYGLGEAGVAMGRRGRAKVETICRGHLDRLLAFYAEARSLHHGRSGR